MQDSTYMHASLTPWKLLLGLQVVSPTMAAVNAPNLWFKPYEME